MGNAFAAVISSLAEIYYKLLEKANSLRSSKNSRYYNSEILLKDEEMQADMNQIEEQKSDSTRQSKKPIEMKNEYHLIKNNDETDNFMGKHNEENNENNEMHEMEDIKKELDEIRIEGKHIESNGDQNLDELKEQILENGDDH